MYKFLVKLERYKYGKLHILLEFRLFGQAFICQPTRELFSGSLTATIYLNI